MPLPPLPPLTVAAADPAEWRQWAMIAGGALLLGYLVLRPMLGGRGGVLGSRTGGRDPLARSPGQLDLARQRATERQLESLLVELESMSRAISGQLDTRAARLEALIAEADAKVAELRGAVDSARGEGGDGRRPVPADPFGPARRPPVEPPGREESNLAPPSPRVDPTTAEIYALSDGGQPSAAIAQKLNRPSGEIELILALRPR